MKEKIGVGIITCNRPDMLRVCYDSIPRNRIDELVIINDGKPLEGDFSKAEIVQHDTNMGVAKTKNDAFQFLIGGNCDHIFLIEDDMLITNPSIFEEYIRVSKHTGIQHLMFGYHGPANKNNISKGPPVPRKIIQYPECELALNTHCVGAFCYYTKKSLLDCRYINTEYKNAFDHVSHSYRLAQKGYSTPYWWWSDVWDSNKYIKEQKCSEESSSIKTPDQHDKWLSNIHQSMALFKQEFGVMPFGPDGVRDTPEEDVLKFLKLTYGRPKS
jgi:glycosyltransferase involved in cell wall biosynthesis